MQVAATIDDVRIGITFLHSMELVYLAPPVGIEPADVLLSLPQSRSPLASYTASHLCALCRRPADHFYPWSSLRPYRIG
jgi:hypothetical protein